MISGIIAAQRVIQAAPPLAPLVGFMAVSSMNASPFVTIYSRSGDTFTKLANPATLPSSDSSGVAYYPGAFYPA